VLLKSENINNSLKDLIILKVGGSVFLKDNILDIANFILSKFRETKLIIVVSAIGRSPYPYSTDELIKTFNSIIDINNKEDELIKLSKSFVISCGENISAGLIATVLNILNKDIKAIPLNAFQSKIITTDNFVDADIIDIEENIILDLIDKGYTPVICGFQGVSKKGYLTTLKRGGTDITAAFLAKKLKPYFNLKGVYIIKDIDSLKIAPPNIIENPISIDYCNYDELTEITYNGSQVVHNDAVNILHSDNIPLIITSVNSTKQTIINNNYNPTKLITNISVKQNLAITGSMNQLGQAQPVGGIKEKIEGFFEICKYRNHFPAYVIIPHQNINDLILKEEVIQYIKDKKFKIYAVKNIDEVIKIATDTDARVVHKKVINKLKEFYLKSIQKNNKKNKTTKRKGKK